MHFQLEQRLDRLRNTIPNTPAKPLNYRGRVAEQFRHTPFNPLRWTSRNPLEVMLGFYKGGREVLWSTGTSFHARNIFYGDLASPYHTQVGLSLNYVIKGQITKMLMGRLITLHAGEGCIMDPNCIHCELVDPHDAILLCINIAPDYLQSELYDPTVLTDCFILESFSERSPLKRYLLFRSTHTAEPLEQLFDQLLTEQNDAEQGSSLILQGLMRRLFHRIEQHCVTEIVTSADSYEHDIIFFEIDRYIRAHLAKISATELEDVFHFNRNYYNQLIKSQTGKTFSNYLAQLRLEKAKHLLADTEESIQSICTQIGYENRTFFYKIFRREFGQTPSEFCQATQSK